MTENKRPQGRQSGPAKAVGKAGSRVNAARKRAAGQSASGPRPKKEAVQRASRPRRSEAPPRVRRDVQSDLFLERRPGMKKKKKKVSRAYIALDVLFLTGIIGLLALGVRQYNARAEYLQMKQAVEKQTYYAGTTIENVDVSGMTLNDAMTYWETRVEPRYAERTVTLDDGSAVTARELGYASDYAAVLTYAWNAGRSGSLEERYAQILDRQARPAAYEVRRSLYDDGLVAQYARNAAAQVDRPARSATIESFDAESYQFVFGEGEPGATLDAEALRSDVERALENGGGSVQRAIATIQPEISRDDIADKYGLIAYAVTNASSSSKNRLANIKTAMGYINGMCVKPGETFSFNAAVGQRTAARGFKLATAYSGGEVTEQVGGGICQVSTTLFNAAVKADLEIVERHNHSLTVAYVDKGKDATVDWGHQDLKFKNTSAENVYICCYLTDDKRVRFGIFGRLLENGETITVEARTTETIKFDTQYQATPLLASGETQVIQEGRDGFVAEAYKVRWDADGNQISRELLCKSKYQSKAAIVAYGA